MRTAGKCLLECVKSCAVPIFFSSRRRHTRCLSDWSSDVCSSDLLTLIALDRPTADFAAVFTRNAFPGAPVLVGRARLDGPSLGAILINNKISNVCAPGGVAAAERICEE